MEKQIELEMDGRAPDEIEELNLDSCKATEITGLTDKFVNLRTLSMTNNELASLKGFPKLPNLQKLDLTDNKLSSGFEPLAECEELEYISLCGNPIKDISVLEPLKKLESLQTLELANCELTSVDGYRDKVFELLDNVLFIDGFDREGEAAPEDYDESDSEGDDEEVEDDVDEESEEDEEDDEDGSGEDEETPTKGTKRKHEDEENDG